MSALKSAKEYIKRIETLFNNTENESTQDSSSARHSNMCDETQCLDGPQRIKKPPDFGNYDFNGSWDTRTYHDRFIPIPVKGANDNLVYISDNVNKATAIQLDFTDSHEMYTIPQTLKYSEKSNRDAHRLGNGKIVVTSMNHEDQLLMVTDLKKICWKATIIDLVAFTHRHFTVAKSDTPFITLLPYYDAFDVILGRSSEENRYTKVARYNDKGKLVKTFKIGIPKEHLRHARLVKECDPSEGYYYIMPMKQRGSSILKKLDSNFKMVGSYKFHHSKYQTYDSNAHSSEHGRFTICYFDRDIRRSLKCLMLDGKLSSVRAIVDMTYEYDLCHVTVRNLPDGAMLVYGRNVGNRTYSLHVQHVSEIGTVGESLEIGKVEDAIDDVYIFEMRNDSYEIVVTTKSLIMKKRLVPAKM